MPAQNGVLPVESPETGLLQISGLTTSFRVGKSYYPAVDGVNLTVAENEVFAIVGESGCGKSALALSILNLHIPTYTKITGRILFDGKNLLAMDEDGLNGVRGKEIGMIFQDPLTALNPLMKIGAQIEESLTFHTQFSKKERKERVMELLKGVGIVSPALTYSQLPHELSGGMRQRAMIAIALSCKPRLVIADEPTTALDVTIQAQILDLLKDLQAEMNAGIILITHDLGVVAEMADKVAVMYAGQIVETGTAHDIFHEPSHPYTRSLLASVPGAGDEEGDLKVIEGIVPSLANIPRSGCRFSHRIPWLPDEIHEAEPTYHDLGHGHEVLCTCHKNFRFRGL